MTIHPAVGTQPVAVIGPVPPSERVTVSDAPGAPPIVRPGPTARLQGVARLLRPKHWIKNGFVLAPLLFSREFLHPASLADAFVALGYFCATASAVYVLNDLLDAARDRVHPVKRYRPIASGLVPVSVAWVVLIGLWALILTSALVLPPLFTLILVGYALLNVAYSARLKHLPVVDVFTIATGFVLRVIGGSVAIGVSPSSWMCVTVLCLSLYLAAIKRRQEMRSSGTAARRALESYSIPLIDRYAEMSATGALVFYSMFVLTQDAHLTVTVPLVIYGLYRYWYVVDRHGHGESPTDALLHDWQLLSVVAAWAAVAVVALSGLV